MWSQIITFLNNIFSLFNKASGEKLIQGQEKVRDAISKIDKDPKDTGPASNLLK